MSEPETPSNILRGYLKIFFWIMVFTVVIKVGDGVARNQSKLSSAIARIEEGEASLKAEDHPNASICARSSNFDLGEVNELYLIVSGQRGRAASLRERSRTLREGADVLASLEVQLAQVGLSLVDRKFFQSIERLRKAEEWCREAEAHLGHNPSLVSDGSKLGTAMAAHRTAIQDLCLSLLDKIASRDYGGAIQIVGEGDPGGGTSTSPLASHSSRILSSLLRSDLSEAADLAAGLYAIRDEDFGLATLDSNPSLDSRRLGLSLAAAVKAESALHDFDRSLENAQAHLGNGSLQDAEAELAKAEALGSALKETIAATEAPVTLDTAAWRHQTAATKSRIAETRRNIEYTKVRGELVAEGTAALNAAIVEIERRIAENDFIGAKTLLDGLDDRYRSVFGNLVGVSKAVENLSDKDFKAAADGLAEARKSVKPELGELMSKIGTAIEASRRRNSEAQREIAGTVKALFDELPLSTDGKRPEIRGRVIVWDFTKSEVFDTYGMLPPELRGGPLDRNLTIYCILERTQHLVGRYSISGAPGYRVDTVIGVAYWPEKTVAWKGKIVGSNPVEQRIVRHSPEYGQAIDVKDWILSSPRVAGSIKMATRKWTNREGKTILAGADAVAGGRVAITLHDGKKAVVLLDQLIDSDQRLLCDFFDVPPPPPPGEAASPAPVEIQAE